MAAAAKEEAEVAGAHDEDEHSDKPEDLVTALVTAHGLQLFKPEDDAEEQEEEGGKVALKNKAASVVFKVVTRLPVNMALGVAVGVPGIVFGIGGLAVGGVHSSIAKRRHAKAVTKQGITITIRPVAAVGLADIRKEARLPALHKTNLSPYLKATLLMNGVDLKANAFHAKSKPHLGGGTDFAFDVKNVVQLGMPDAGADCADVWAHDARESGLLLELKDEPISRVARAVARRDTLIGMAVVGLGQLVEQMNGDGNGVSAHFINVPLYRRAEAADKAVTAPTGGTLRLHVTLERKAHADPKAAAAK